MPHTNRQDASDVDKIDMDNNMEIINNSVEFNVILIDWVKK